jgi:hypothetical protein
VADDGSNTWNDSGKGQFYVVEKVAPAQMQTLIDGLMMQPPKAQHQ